MFPLNCTTHTTQHTHAHTHTHTQTHTQRRIEKTAWRNNPPKQRSCRYYRCTTWTLTILNKVLEWLYSHLPPITKTIQVRKPDMQAAGEVGTSSLLWTPSHGRAKAGRPTRISVRIRGVALRTYWMQWTIRGDEKGSISVPTIRWYIYIYNFIDLMKENGFTLCWGYQGKTFTTQNMQMIMMANPNI